MVEARYYRREGDYLICELCPNFCKIAEDKVGRCLGRKNIGGKLYAINYGEVVSMAIDPMEKKPLYHFYPGEEIFSVATYGCNLLCPFCQNWEISQKRSPSRYLSPENLIEEAKKHFTKFIAYTYTEPVIWFEYLLAVTKLAHEAGIKNVLVTNGMINEDPLRELLPHIDAMNIDLKSIRDEFYSNFIKGNLGTVLNTIRIAKKSCHIELTNLLIPGKNDKKEDIADLVDFVSELGKETVLHFSRYFPHYKLSLPPTPIETLRLAYKIGKEKLYYVYVGNVSGFDNHTVCPGCGNLLVVRDYFRAEIIGIKNRACARCGRKVDLIL